MKLPILLAVAALCVACIPVDGPLVSEPPEPTQPDPVLDHFAVCEAPIDPQRTCDSVGDCWDASQCSVDYCDLAALPDPPDPSGRKGTCRWEPRPDGTPCDLPARDGTDACVQGLCCAVEVEADQQPSAPTGS